MLWYFLVPLIPTILWVIYFYRHDNFDKEPKKLIYYSIVLGALATFFIARAEGQLLRATGLYRFMDTVGGGGLLAMLLVGLIEETGKFLVLRLSFYRSKYFNEISDGIIYAVGIGLGFAFVENIFYSLQFGLTVSVIRALITPIFHASSAAIAGYFLARSAFQGPYLLRFYGLFLASLVHGLSNFLLISAANLLTLAPIILLIALNLIFIVWVLKVYRRSATEGVEKERIVKNSPGLAAVLNIVPGFGFIYLNFWELGLIYLSVAILISILLSLSPFLLPGLYPLAGVIFNALIILMILFSAVFSYKNAKAL